MVLYFSLVNKDLYSLKEQWGKILIGCQLSVFITK